MRRSFFFKLLVTPPDVAGLVSILERTTAGAEAIPDRAADGEAILRMRRLSREVLMSTPVAEHIARLVSATHPDRAEAPPIVKQFVRYGSSPRGAQALALAARVHALRQGRFNVAYEDVRAVATPALRHRLIRSFEGEAEGIAADTIVEKVLEATEHAAATRP